MVFKASQIIFALSNIILTFGSVGFYLLIFGKENSIVHKWNFVAHWSLRTGLAFIISASFLKSLLFEMPSMIDLFMASGLAMLFMWAFMFHYKYFK